MATRLPLVIGTDGLPQQLQSGDTLSAPINTPMVRSVTNADSVSLPFGTPVYISAADSVKRAQANAKNTSGVGGLVFDSTIAAAAAGQIANAGILVGTTAQWDAVTGQTGGLTFNSLYFLDPANNGKITTSVPTTVGQCVALVGRALSATEMELMIDKPILL
jgi:hypothetical protein